MKLRTIYIIISLLICSTNFGQSVKTPKNLKQAVKWLDASTTDSIKTAIKSSKNDTIKNINYPYKGKFKTIYDWTSSDNPNSKISDYLNKKGIFYHDDEVILICFKNYLLFGKFNEKEILAPFQKLEAKWNVEDEVRYTTDSLRGHYIPKNLEDSFKSLDRIYSDSIKVEITKLSEDEYISGNYRFGIGLWMRNNWQLWGGSRLSKFFRDNGINHPESMSVVLLESYHRYLNHQDLKFQEQKETYLKYEEEEKIRQQKRLEEELSQKKKDFDELKIGDILEFNYKYQFSSEEQESKWMDDSCIAKGILIEKNEKLLTIKVQVTEACGKRGIVIYSNDDHHIFNKKKKRLTSPEKREIEYLKEKEAAWFNVEDWDKM
ncbi:hypothetical protein HUK80_17515 [Flavobacterium sp. MAH-1]|uniref:DUF6794 domain-containing protein n=1 Tax=Flavobacterium agri TaxID=2743471 RepID=A0A7Y8Y539_9FLAO|nr:DUF6794 domain-containing protein [Flavobacterium agri]NUY82705.1 hypothetical protein [Flavobacterium agri]NYA72728.1 hypothetical protein [Flavobacterium agri]